MHAAIGVDPWCVSVDTAQKWERAFAKKQQKLVQTSTNLVDEVWKSRPPLEINPVIVHPREFSGCSVQEKLKDLREKLVQEKVRAIIITALDEVAWLYNIRGTDVSYSPVVHAYAMTSSYMEKNGIDVWDYSAVSSDVILLASDHLTPSSSAKKAEHEIPNKIDSNSHESGNDTVEEESSNNLVWIDGTCCFALYSKLNVDRVLMQPSPLGLAKALMNPVEMEGLKNAHIRNGAAVVRYLVWLDKQMQEL